MTALGREPLEVAELRPTSSMTEATLIAGYGAARRIEPCVCGGWIVATDTPIAVAAAVRLHNDTIRHEAWRAQKGADR